MSIEDLNYNELNSMENEIRARREEIRPTIQHFGSAENLSKSDTELQEAMIKYQNGQIKPTTQHYGSAENLSRSDTELQEAMIKYQNGQIKPTTQHYGSAENLSRSETELQEAMIKYQNGQIKPTTQHYGSAENFSRSETEFEEARIRYQRSQIDPSFQHYGSVENLSKSDTEILEAQVAEKRMQEKPFTEYLNDLVLNPTITDDTVFENAVIKGMQSKQILKQFMENLTTKINTEIFKIRNIDNSDKLSIENSKNNIEKLVAVYQKALYTLKKYNYNFNTYDTGLDTMKLSDETISQLWQLERNKGISFKIPIPANLGEYYGKEYTRDGKMVAGLRLMHDNLLGKEVNWHQILNYKEGELTPAQLYKKRQQEKFEQARKQELQTLSLNLNKDNLNRETQEESLESTRGVR